VLNSNGLPAINANVILYNQQPTYNKVSLTKRLTGSLPLKIITDTEGYFRIDSVDTGTYLIGVYDNCSQGVMMPAIVSNRDTIVPVNGILAMTGSINGVIDPVQMSTLSNAVLYIPEIHKIIQIDSSGNFSNNNLAVWNYTLRIIASDTLVHLVTDSIKVNVKSGDTTFTSNVGALSFTLYKDTNTLALWNFNQGLGTIVVDESGNANTGTFLGSTQWITSAWGTGIVFDSGCGITITNSPSVQLSNFMIVAKVYPTTFSKYNNILAKEGGGATDTGGYILRFDNYGYITGAIKDFGSWTNISTSSTVPLNTWYLIKMVKTSSWFALYVNNILVDSISVSINPTRIDGNLAIGYDVNMVEDRAFRGYIDAIKINRLQ